MRNFRRSALHDTRQGGRPPLVHLSIPLLVALLVAGCLGLIACQKQAEVPNTTISAVSVKEPTATTSTSAPASLKIAFIADTDPSSDPYNQAVEDGIKSYISGLGTQYTREDANSSSASSAASAASSSATLDTVVVQKSTDASRTQSIEKAIDDGATVIVCAGGTYSQVVYTLQSKYENVMFLLVDSQPASDSGTVSLAKNVHSIMFRNDQLGYLVGYALVMDGYTSIGFAGGQKYDDVTNFGYGFLEGADAAATQLGISDTLDVRYWYSGTFEASNAVQQHVAAWYKAGVQAVFSCGGGIYSSVAKAAEANDGYMVGVDVDQASVSDRVLTSAVKNLSSSVASALSNISWNGDAAWSDGYAGQTEILGAAEGAIGLSTGDSWRFQNFTEDDYNAALGTLADGTVKVSVNPATRPTLSIDVTYDSDGTSSSTTASKSTSTASSSSSSNSASGSASSTSGSATSAGSASKTGGSETSAETTKSAA